MHQCLVSIAQHELNVLAQDTKNAINGLECQRESVMQAIEVAQHANKCHSDLRDKTDVLVTELLNKLYRLSAALGQVMHEIEQIEATQSSPSVGPLIAWPISLDLASYGKHRWIVRRDADQVPQLLALVDATEPQVRRTEDYAVQKVHFRELET
jgi:hypothetical protein